MKVLTNILKGAHLGILFFFIVCGAEGLMGDRVIVWVDGVEWAEHDGDPIPAQGFYKDPVWDPNWNDYVGYYKHDGTKTVDPNVVDHFLEIIPEYGQEDCPMVYLCHAYKGWNDELDITGKDRYVYWKWTDEFHQEFQTERIYGGDNQQWNPTVPAEGQCYWGGTVWTYHDPVITDFMQWWLNYHPAFDFNKDGIVNNTDYAFFVCFILE